MSPPRATPLMGTRTRATRNRIPRPTRIRDTASTATAGRTTRPEATPTRTRTRGTAPSATTGRTTPTAAGAAPTRIRIRRLPRASRPSRRSRTRQIRPRAGNRGGGAGVTRYQPVRLCPRAAPTAFAEYRSAGAALRLSPRGDLRTGQRDEGPAGLPAGPSFCPGAVVPPHAGPGGRGCACSGPPGVPDLPSSTTTGSSVSGGMGPTTALSTCEFGMDITLPSALKRT